MPPNLSVADLGMVGIGVAATLWALKGVIKLVMPMIQKKSGGNGSSTGKGAQCLIPEDIDVRKMFNQVNDLWAWHNVRDQDQVPVWYVPSKMANALADLVEILREMRHDISIIKERLE